MIPAVQNVKNRREDSRHRRFIESADRAAGDVEVIPENRPNIVRLRDTIFGKTELAAREIDARRKFTTLLELR